MTNFSRETLKLYFVAGTQDCRHLPHTPEQNLLGVLETALQNGITCYQLREKGAHALQDEARIRRLAGECRALCRRYGVPFVLNNDVRSALAWGADGVHIGQQDMPLREAANLCRGKIFLGISNNSLANAQTSAAAACADYLAAGRFSRPNPSPMPKPLWAWTWCGRYARRALPRLWWQSAASQPAPRPCCVRRARTASP